MARGERSVHAPPQRAAAPEPSHSTAHGSPCRAQSTSMVRTPFTLGPRSPSTRRQTFAASVVSDTFIHRPRVVRGRWGRALEPHGPQPWDSSADHTYTPRRFSPNPHRRKGYSVSRSPWARERRAFPSDALMRTPARTTPRSRLERCRDIGTGRGRADLRRSPPGLLSACPLFLSPRAVGTPSRARGGNDPANLRNAEVRALRAKGHAANIGNPHVGSIHARVGLHSPPTTLLIVMLPAPLHVDPAPMLKELAGASPFDSIGP